MNTGLFSIILLTLAVVPAGGSLHAQSNATSYECSQPAQERDALIREAETDGYFTRRVEFVGPRHTRDAVLRRRLSTGLQEGEFFTRRNLVQSLQNLSRVKQVFPVNMRDVEVTLNRPDRVIDLLICFRERPTRRTRAR